MIHKMIDMKLNNNHLYKKNSNDTIARTQEDKTTFLKSLIEMDREKRLSEYLWNGISLFYEIYENEMSLVQQDKI